MPPQGRPRLPSTEAQRAAARRQQVRENVRAFRRRRREHDDVSETQAESTESENVNNENSSGNSTDRNDGSGSSTSQTISDERPGRQISLRGDEERGSIKWSLSLPLRIELGPAYTSAFIAAFHYRGSPIPSLDSPQASSDLFRNIVARGSPDNYVRVQVCCFEWLTTVSFQAQCPRAEMLKDALLAASLNTIGMERKDPRLAVAAIQTQISALRKLREGFDDYIANRDVKTNALLSATALACSISELLVSRSWSGYSLHLKGVGALIEDAGPDALTTRDSRGNFFGYRTAQLPFTFLTRRSSFLSRPEWNNFSWRTSDSRFNLPRDTLLDIAYQVTAQIELFDRTPSRNSDWNKRQLRKLKGLVGQLNEWRTDLFAKHSESIYTTEAAAWRGLHSEYIKFRDDSVASAFTLYIGVRIELFALVRQLAGDLKDDDTSAVLIFRGAIEEGFKWSRIACQCLEYFFTRERRVMGKVSCLFPFDAAWGTFAVLSEQYEQNMSLELRWCQTTAARIEATGLPVFRVRHHIEGVGEI